MIRWTAAARWGFWFGVSVLATGVLRWARVHLDPAYVALTLLLIVLGGSVSGGRPLGFVLSAVGFAILDYFFQPPFGSLSVHEPLDGIVLVAFLAVAFVATELLARSQQQRAAAEERASEVQSLARLGASTLRYAEPEQTLEAIAALVRDALRATTCAFVDWRDRESSGVPRGALLQTPGTLPLPETINGALLGGEPVLVTAEGTITIGASALGEEGDGVASVRTILLPLLAEEQVIGVMIVRSEAELLLDAPRRRLLAALRYYAALAIERGQLKVEAARTEALRQAQRMRDEIVAAVSHDLRTPITTIKVLAQSGAQVGDPVAAAIVEQADRLARMVADLLELSRLRAGSHALAPELNTLEDLIGAALRQVHGSLAGRSIRVDVDLDSPALVGRFDFVQTLRILGNLLDNALRHTPPAGTVEVTAKRDEGWLLLSVLDRGPGVPPEEQRRIFEPFYRPASAAPDAGHAGLGLSIARGLAELQGGSVTYVAREGGGSTFTLRLPAADVEELSTADPLPAGGGAPS